MYHATLTNRYLTSRLIPLIAVAAVALCVALVIIVVSVMTGFLDMVRESGRTLMGDVVVSYPVSGIPHYEELIRRIEKLPEASAAAPVVDGLGLLKMPYPSGPDKQVEMVQFWGIDERFAKVTGYADTLYWNPQKLNPDQWRNLRRRLYADALTRSWPEIRSMLSEDQRVELLRRVLNLDLPEHAQPFTAEQARARLATLSEPEWQQVVRMLRFEEQILKEVLTPEQWQTFMQNDPRLLDDQQIVRDGVSLTFRGSDQSISMGMHVSEGNDRQPTGEYEPAGLGQWWMPRYEVTLTTIPVRDSGGDIDKEDSNSKILQVVNEFVSGVFLIDDRRVMIPLRIAQEMLRLDAAKIVENGEVTGDDPARATMVLVRANEGYSPEKLRNAVEQVYFEFSASLRNNPEVAVKPPDADLDMSLSIRTWAEQQAQFIGPIEKEREIMRTLFSLVYLVCAGLVLAIFWAIVYEKTRDIGILRSIGASRMGISWIFLRYGLLIGIAGAICGLGLAFLVVRNINIIHDALGDPPQWLIFVMVGLAVVSFVFTVIRGRSGRLVPIVLGSFTTITLALIGGLIFLLRQAGGVTVWDPSIYYFSEIPNHVDLNSAYITMVGAVFFSLLGAFIPAAKAADTDPVTALRYE